jgi:hypothetical protein
MDEERGSGPLRSLCCLVINSIAMFSYSPHSWIQTCDNLASGGRGSASIKSVQSGVRIGKEQHIAIDDTAIDAMSKGGGLVLSSVVTLIF